MNAMRRLAANFSELFCCNCEAFDNESVRNLHCGFSESLTCRGCEYCHRPSVRTHQYGFQEAERWSGSYTYYCPKGLTFCTFVGESDEGKICGIILGPCILGEPQDLSLAGTSVAFNWGLGSLPVFTPQQMNNLSGIGLMSVRGVTAGRAGHRSAYDQSEFLNELYGLRGQVEQGDRDYSYILHVEERIKSMIKSMDAEGAQKLLNDMVGRIYLQCHFDLDEVKTRCIELAAVLSRTAIDGGVEMGRIFHFSTGFLRQVNEVKSIDELCEWMSDILHSFMDAMFDFSKIKHADAVYKTMSYIRIHWQERPTLEDISRSVFLSKSYLSMLFKQETGMGISTFLNQVRIEHSKELLTTTGMSLAAIATECGFNDQSYYTKVFQKCVGISPKKYRSKQVSVQ